MEAFLGLVSLGPTFLEADATASPSPGSHRQTGKFLEFVSDGRSYSHDPGASGTPGTSHSLTAILTLGPRIPGLQRSREESRQETKRNRCAEDQAPLGVPVFAAETQAWVEAQVSDQRVARTCFRVAGACLQGARARGLLKSKGLCRGLWVALPPKPASGSGQ